MENDRSMLMSQVTDRRKMCNCEHFDHFDDHEFTRSREAHAYMSVPAGSKKAAFVGAICDDCAKHCVPDWLVLWKSMTPPQPPWLTKSRTASSYTARENQNRQSTMARPSMAHGRTCAKNTSAHTAWDWALVVDRSW